MIRDSYYWLNHFKQNLKIQRVDWTIPPSITEEEKSQVIYSLKAWQLGETSDGKHLLAAARNYAMHVNEPAYPEAVKLFIREEQKHGKNLGKYIDAIEEQRAKTDWGDTIFRKIRYFNTSMELWTVTVIIVESAAQVFYQALHDATNCTLLKSICKDIIMDEAHHIKFQNERLFKIFQRKHFYSKAFSLAWYSLLFFATIHAVWLGHRKALIKGGVNKREFMRQMYFKFFHSMKFIHSANTSVLQTRIVAV